MTHADDAEKNLDYFKFLVALYQSVCYINRARRKRTKAG